MKILGIDPGLATIGFAVLEENQFSIMGFSRQYRGIHCQIVLFRLEMIFVRFWMSFRQNVLLLKNFFCAECNQWNGGRA